MDEVDMYRALTKDGLLSDKDFEALMMINQNIFVPDELSENNILLGELETKSPIDYEKILQLYSDFYGSEIKDHALSDAKTREFMATNYATKVDVNGELNKILNRFDALEKKLDRWMEKQ